jgi:hypothetical protein
MIKKDHHLYIEVEIQDWNDWFLINQRFLSCFVFRGHASEEWNLSTSLERFAQRTHPNFRDPILPAVYEGEMITDFSWKYMLYEKNHIPSKDDLVEWLTIMQHYGAPTRLLDFTQSIYVALWMAVNENLYDRSAIWALNSTVIRLSAFAKYSKENNVNSAGHDILEKWMYDHANASISTHRVKSNIGNELFVVRPKNCNERISRQQGLFVVPANIERSFHDNLSQYLDNQQPTKISIGQLKQYSHTNAGKLQQEQISLIKFVIPRKFNLEIMRMLRSMNITAESLFPGLDGLAKSMASLRWGWGDYQE